MTDKQIIINGIDVSRCEYRDWRNSCHCDNSKENEGEKRVTGRGGCKYNPNCYYKQLKRKEKACKEWKEEYRAKVEELNELEEKLLRKEQECERLKWYLKEIRYDELKNLDIECDEYETHCIDTEYSNIINLVEEALEERSPEDCRYRK